MQRLIALVAAITVMTGAAAAADAPLIAGKIVDSVPSLTDPTQSYAYYVPSTYDPQSSWPILFVFDPRERGAFAAELFRESAELYGWIVISSNDTHSNMSTEENARALQAMWSDAPRRFAIDKRRIYAAGFSGGAIMAWWLGRATKMLAGVIGCGGRITDKRDLEEVTFDWYGLVGDTDFNYSEMRLIERGLSSPKPAPPRTRLEFFPGGHRWPPPQRLREAMDWMEVQAIRRGARARDGSFLAAQLEKESTTARQHEQNGDLVAAMRAWQNIDRTYEGLIDTSDARNRAAALRQQSSVMSALRDDQKADELESTFRSSFPRLITEYAQASEQQSSAFLSSQLRIAYLKKLARERSPTGRAAQRVLEMAFVQLSRTADELAARSSERAANMRLVAQEIGK